MLLALLACAATPAPPPATPAAAPTDAAADAAWGVEVPERAESIYFVLVDRFIDGDPDNNGDIDRGDPQAWHGGDLRGVIDNLDHIQSLGFTTIWLSPIYQSRQEKFHEWGAFHGYWVEDPRALEPRFGDEAALIALRDALEARGMELVLDVVYNHLSFDAPLVSAHPEWLHDEGGIEDWDDPEEVITHQVHGLPDLAQERPEVYDFLLDASLKWIDLARPAGFRVDAVRHMPASFLADIADDLKEAAGEDFILLGEMFEGDPVKLAETARAGGFSHVFDFPLHYAMVDVFCEGAPAGRLAGTLSADRNYAGQVELVTFLDNHDLPRVTSACGEDLAKVEAALTFQLTTRGVPSVTWGTEAALTGAEEPENRKDMTFDAPHPLAGPIRELLALRAAHPALAHGSTHLTELDGGLFAYTRWAPGEGALIAVNVGDEERVAALPNHWMGAPLTVLRGAATEDERGLVVAPGEVAVAVIADARPTAVLANRARVSVTAAAAPVPEGGKLRLVGPGAMLGNWDPAKAPALTDGALELMWRRHEVLEAKLVIEDAEGNYTWQEGVNFYALIGGDSSHVLIW